MIEHAPESEVPFEKLVEIFKNDQIGSLTKEQFDRVAKALALSDEKREKRREIWEVQRKEQQAAPAQIMSLESFEAVHGRGIIPQDEWDKIAEQSGMQLLESPYQPSEDPDSIRKYTSIRIRTSENSNPVDAVFLGSGSETKGVRSYRVQLKQTGEEIDVPADMIFVLHETTTKPEKPLEELEELEEIKEVKEVVEILAGEQVAQRITAETGFSPLEPVRISGSTRETYLVVGSKEEQGAHLLELVPQIIFTYTSMRDWLKRVEEIQHEAQPNTEELNALRKQIRALSDRSAKWVPADKIEKVPKNQPRAIERPSFVSGNTVSAPIRLSDGSIKMITGTLEGYLPKEPKAVVYSQELPGDKQYIAIIDQSALLSPVTKEE